MTTKRATWLASDEAERPAAQAGHRAQRVVARVPAPAQQPEVGPAQARDERHALEDDPERGAEPEQDELGVVLLHAGQRGAVAGPEPEPDQDADADDVVDDRRPGDGDEAAAGVEQRGRQREEAVGGDLDHEPAQERRWPPGARAGRGGSGRRAACVSSTVRASMRNGAATSAATVVTSRTTTDTVRTAEMDSKASRLGLVGQAVDEDGDEGGGEDAAQHDVVEHVGRGVGQVVGVGQRRLARGPRPGRRSGAAR